MFSIELRGVSSSQRCLHVGMCGGVLLPSFRGVTDVLPPVLAVRGKERSLTMLLLSNFRLCCRLPRSGWLQHPGLTTQLIWYRCLTP